MISNERRALVVESDRVLRARVADGLTRAGASVEVAGDVSVALAVLGASAPDLAVVGFDSPLLDGLQLLESARDVAPGARLVEMSGDPERVASGFADETLRVPWSDERLSELLQQPARPIIAPSRVSDRIVGRHPSMQRLLQKANQAAQSRSTVLITGETGSGKEEIAAWVHERSARSEGPFVRLNCAALAESVIESELFGHEKGAFTGAGGQRIGRFEQASGGTIFLDEVGEISPAIQVKLLGVLQERSFERVGGNRAVRVDVRIIAATNRDLTQAVRTGRFREDLFYRLNVIRLEVPPLRARATDIPLLAAHFLRVQEEDGQVLEGFTDAAMEALVRAPWPGNVRELANAIEQAAVLAQGPRIDVGDLPFSAAPAGTALGSLRGLVPGITLGDLERMAILETLLAYDGSTADAARVLGISRRKIQYRLRQWGLIGYGLPLSRAGTE